MGKRVEMSTPDISEEESGEAFTDGDFEDSDEEPIVELRENDLNNSVPVNETLNMDVKAELSSKSDTNGLNGDHSKVNGLKNGTGKDSSYSSGDPPMLAFRRDSHGEQIVNPSIVGILGDQQNHVRILILNCV